MLRYESLWLPADMMIDETLDKARQLRDEMVARSVQSSRSTARHIYKIYPEADSEALPEAMESLLGACSGALCAATHAWVAQTQRTDAYSSSVLNSRGVCSQHSTSHRKQLM